MPVVPLWLRTAASRLRRWYVLACARDDARRYELHIPAGVWACGHCRFFSFDALDLRGHVLLAHVG